MLNNGAGCKLTVLAISAFMIITVDTAAQTLQQYYNRGIALTRENKFSEAVELYSRAIQAYPGEAHLYGNMAHCLSRLGRYGDSVTAYGKAMELAPGHQGLKENAAWTYYSYAWDRFSSGNHNEALRLTGKAIDLGQNFQFYLRHSQIARSLKNYSISARAISDSLAPGKQQKNPLEYYNWLSHEAGSLFRDLKAEKQIQTGKELARTLSFGADDDRVLEDVVDFYFFLKNDTEAGNAVRRIKNPARKNMYEGLILARRGDFSGANSLFDKATAFDRNNYEVPGKISDSLYAISEDQGVRSVIKNPQNLMAMEYQKTAVGTYLRVKRYGAPRVFLPPLKGDFISIANPLLGDRTWHTGYTTHHCYDFIYSGVPEQMGQPIYAIAEGVVEYAVGHHPDNPANMKLISDAQSNFVSITHTSGLRSRYVHLKQNSVTVNKGDRVKAGRKIGELGNSGYTTGPHLHFTVIDKEGFSVPVAFSNLFRRPKEGSSFSWEKTADLSYTGFHYTTDPEDGGKNTPLWFYSTGDRFEKQKKFGEAAVTYREGTKTFPREAGLFQKLGLASLKTGEYRDSENAFEAALRLSPGDTRLKESAAWSYYTIAWAMYGKKDYNEGMRTNKRGIELLGKYQLYLRYSQICRAAGKIEESARALTASMDEGKTLPSSSDYHNWFSWEANNVFTDLRRAGKTSMADTLAETVVKNLSTDKSLSTAVKYYIDTGQCERAGNILSGMKTQGSLKEDHKHKCR